MLVLLFLSGFLVALMSTLYLVGSKVRVQLANLIGNWTGSVVEAAAPVLAQMEGLLAPIVAAFVGAFQAHGGALANEMRAPFEALARGVFTEATSRMEALGVSSPDTAAAAAADALAQAYGFGLSSAGVTAAFEAVFPEKLNTLNGAAAMIAEMAGFAEVTAKVRDPLYDNAFGKSLEYKYRALFKPDLPSEDDAVSWHARRFLTDAQLRTIFGFSGLKPEYEEPYVQSAYRAVQPRVLATLFQDAPFDEAMMRDMLEKSGIFPQHIPTLIEGYRLNSVKNVRNQYVSSVMTAAERGTLTPAEVDSALTDLNFSVDAKHWVNLTIATRKLEQLAELYRKSVSEAYHFSLITDAQYVPALEAIGIAAADANAHYAVDSEKKLGAAAAAAARAAARLEAQITRAEVRAALANYGAHNVDEIELAAALAVAGMPAQVIPWAVDVAAVRRQSSQRMVFGKLVAANDAVLLREQVAAIKEQVIKKLLTIAPARAALEALGIPPTNAEDLVAEWAAQALKTVLPVQ